MSKSPWFTPPSKRFVFTVKGRTEKELDRKIEEYVNNGYKILKRFSNTAENNCYKESAYYARMEGKSKRA